ncbi:CopD family protein, partial [Bradyrhizobium sp. BR 10289]|uniref:copper resistance D family protein n=1 Tax=Bradyrhizobium sp. BR 10289 TaxID=2749993 RepID=UPI001C6451AB
MYLLLDIFGYLSVVLRGLILIAQSFTLGGLAFQILLWEPLRPQLSTGGPTTEQRCRTVLRISAAAWALLTIASLALNAAALVGTLQVSWSEALGADFGRADVVIAASAFGIAVLSKNPARGARAAVLVALAVLALAMQTRLTHAASRPDVRWPLLLSDAGHMLGAGVWIGGLPYFLIALNGCKDAGDWRRIARRYSLMSMAAVAAILLGGLTMAVTYIGSIEAIYGTAYGVMTLAKVGLLLMLLALGAGNYFLVERLRRDPATPILRLKRFAEVEIGIGLTVLLAAASLTSLPPGVDLAQDRLNWQEIVERATPQWPPRLTSPDYDKLTIAQLQARITLADAGRANAQAAYVPG